MGTAPGDPISGCADRVKSAASGRAATVVAYAGDSRGPGPGRTARPGGEWCGGRRRGPSPVLLAQDVRAGSRVARGSNGGERRPAGEVRGRRARGAAHPVPPVAGGPGGRGGSSQRNASPGGR